MFDKYIAIQKNIIHIYIHLYMYSINNASNDVLSNRRIILDNMNDFHIQDKYIDTFDSL